MIELLKDPQDYAYSQYSSNAAQGFTTWNIESHVKRLYDKTNEIVELVNSMSEDLSSVESALESLSMTRLKRLDQSLSDLINIQSRQDAQLKNILLFSTTQNRERDNELAEVYKRLLTLELENQKLRHKYISRLVAAANESTRLIAALESKVERLTNG